MKKITALILGLLFAVLAVVSGILAVTVPAAVVLTVLCVPASLACCIFWWCAGTREGDIPFVGY